MAENPVSWNGTQKIIFASAYTGEELGIANVLSALQDKGILSLWGGWTLASLEADLQRTMEEYIASDLIGWSHVMVIYNRLKELKCLNNYCDTCEMVPFGAHKHCPKCNSAPKEQEIRNYDAIWRDGDVYCTKCGEYVRGYDAS